MLVLLACTGEFECEGGQIEYDEVCYENGGDVPTSQAAPELPSCEGTAWDARGGPLFFACLLCDDDTCTWSLGDLHGFASVALDVGDEEHDGFVADEEAWSIALGRGDYETNVATAIDPDGDIDFVAKGYDEDGEVYDCAATDGSCREAGAVD